MSTECWTLDPLFYVEIRLIIQETHHIITYTNQYFWKSGNLKSWKCWNMCVPLFLQFWYSQICICNCETLKLWMLDMFSKRWLFDNFAKFKLKHFEHIWKRRAPANHEDPPKYLSKTSNIGHEWSGDFPADARVGVGMKRGDSKIWLKRPWMNRSSH